MNEILTLVFMGITSIGALVGIGYTFLNIYSPDDKPSGVRKSVAWLILSLPSLIVVACGAGVHFWGMSPLLAYTILSTMAFIIIFIVLKNLEAIPTTNAIYILLGFYALILICTALLGMYTTGENAARKKDVASLEKEIELLRKKDVASLEEEVELLKKRLKRIESGESRWRLDDHTR